MLPYRGKVLVKAKKWHKGGGLVAPFVEARVLCPSHLVNGGWVVQLQDRRVLHVRDMVQLQLEEDDRPGQPHRRLTGKQPLGNTPRLGETTAVVTAAGPTSAGGGVFFVVFIEGAKKFDLETIGRTHQRDSRGPQQQHQLRE